MPSVPFTLWVAPALHRCEERGGRKEVSVWINIWATDTMVCIPDNQETKCPLYIQSSFIHVLYKLLETQRWRRDPWAQWASCLSFPSHSPSPSIRYPTHHVPTKNQEKVCLATWDHQGWASLFSLWILGRKFLKGRMESFMKNTSWTKFHDDSN